MSHVIASNAVYTDLEVLEAVCEPLGLELVRDKSTFRWWGRHVGDYPVPEGFTADDMGKCEHVIRVKDVEGSRTASDAPYEVGLVAARGENQEGYVPMFDFYGGPGRQIQALVGEGCNDLTDAYVMGLAEKLLPNWMQEAEPQADGSMVLTLTH